MRQKKNGKYLNVYIDESVHRDFAEFCSKIGQSKSLAVQRAIMLYMKAMKKDGINISDGKEQ